MMIAVVFPFDLFGSAGTAAGAQLLGDALRELIADNRREKQATRARAYADQFRVQEVAFETLDDLNDWRRTALHILRRSQRQDGFPIWLSGNHLGVLPIYEELAGQPNPPTVLQLDAHLDIYDLTDCTSELSHGNFLRHAVARPPIVQFGSRDLFLPTERIQGFYRAVFAAEDFHIDPLGTLNGLTNALADAERIWLDIDCDVLDPSFFPAVLQPLPFGLAPSVLPAILERIGRGRLCGVSISEFAPGADVADRGLHTVMWFLERLLLWRTEDR